MDSCYNCQVQFEEDLKWKKENRIGKNVELIIITKLLINSWNTNILIIINKKYSIRYKNFYI